MRPRLSSHDNGPQHPKLADRKAPRDLATSRVLRQPWRARPVPWQRHARHSLVLFAQSLGFCRVWKQSCFSSLSSISKTNIVVSIQKCSWQVLYLRVRGVREFSCGGRCTIGRRSLVWLLLRTDLRHSQPPADVASSLVK